VAASDELKSPIRVVDYLPPKREYRIVSPAILVVAHDVDFREFEPGFR